MYASDRQQGGGGCKARCDRHFGAARAAGEGHFTGFGGGPLNRRRAERHMGKFVLLGLDGATFEMLDPMLETGRLPTLSGLLRDGSRGVLASTVPPVTCPAWPTMYTGRNPGAHGFMSFRVLEPGSLRYRSEMLRGVSCGKLWEVLNGAGVRTGLFNVPATYPAEACDGFMVSGFVTPSGAPESVAPEGLREAFGAAFPGYDCNGPQEGPVFNHRSRRRGLIESLRQSLVGRLEALEWLLEREPVDFLWVVLETVDRVSHYAYALLAPDSELYDTEEGRETREWVLGLMEEQDRVIARILERMGPDTDVMVVSDHGFNWTPQLFDVRGWLIDNGYMAVSGKGGVAGWVKGRLRGAVVGLLGRTAWNRLSRMRTRVTGTESHELLSVSWDWSRSRVWHGPFMEYGVRLNTTERGVQGIVAPEACGALAEELVERLAGLENPATGERVFSQVARREALLSGPHVGRAPEVMFVPRRHVIHQTRASMGGRESGGWLVRASNLFSQNNHSSEGIFAAVGKAFRKGEVRGMRIVDVMPTVLHALGVALPADLEGRAVEEAFTEEHRRGHPLETAAAGAGAGAAPGPAAGYSAEDEAAISRRLEELGYL